MSAGAWTILRRTLLRQAGKDSTLAHAVGTDVKGQVSVLLYAAGVALSLPHPWVACGLYVVPAVMWLVPDRRIERQIHAEKRA